MIDRDDHPASVAPKPPTNEVGLYEDLVQRITPQPGTSESCQQAAVGVKNAAVSVGPGRVQRWLIGYVERWEDDHDGYVSKNFLRAGWDWHERENTDFGEHPFRGLTYTALDAFEDDVSPHQRRRSHLESARRAIAKLCKDGTFEESPDERSVRIPVKAHPDDDLASRLTREREYLKAHGQSASDDLLVAVTGNIVVIELESRLTPKERTSFNARCVERGDSATGRIQNLVSYVATKCDVSDKQALRDALDDARRTLAQWREEDL